MNITIGNGIRYITSKIKKDGYIIKFNLCIEDNGMRTYYGLQLNPNNLQFAFQIEPCVIVNSKKIMWDEVPIAVRYAYFRKIFPQGTETEEDIFIYGGKSFLGDEISWAKNHEVYSTYLTLLIREDIGDFESAVLVRSYSDFFRNGAKNYLYLIDNKWLITVYSNRTERPPYAEYTIEDNKFLLMEKEDRHRRSLQLSATYNVPLDIASITEEIDDLETAKRVIRKIKKCKPTEEMKRFLGGTVRKRIETLISIFGEKDFSDFPCEEEKINSLSDYLFDK